MSFKIGEKEKAIMAAAKRQNATTDEKRSDMIQVSSKINELVFKLLNLSHFNGTLTIDEWDAVVERKIDIFTGMELELVRIIKDYREGNPSA